MRLHEALVKFICTTQTSNRNGSRYQKLLDDPLIKQRKIFSTMKQVVKIYCEKKPTVIQSQTPFKNRPLSQVETPPKINFVSEQNQNLPSKLQLVDDDIKIDEKHSNDSAFEQKDQEFSSKIQSMDQKQDRFGSESLVSSTQKLV